MKNPDQPPDENNEPSWKKYPYWAEKGKPKEEFDVLFGERKIEVRNFTDAKLNEAQLKELERVVFEFSQIDGGVAFDGIKFILIDDKQPVDPEHKEGLNGMGVEKGDGIVKLYPRALKPIEHRVKGVSNFEGSLIHEFAHALSRPDEWEKRFGWKLNQEKLRELVQLGLFEEMKTNLQRDWGGLHPRIWELARFWDITEPGRCVTDYAKLGPEDDFADSFVAALRNPKLLDPRRLSFLNDRFLKAINEKVVPAVNIQKR